MTTMGRPARGESVRLEPADEARVDLICDRFEAEWAAGRRPCLEEFLEDGPVTWREELLRGLLAVELAYRRGALETPEPEGYRSRLPELAGVIASVFREVCPTVA